MASVYVSSTIADLTEERQAVFDWLIAAGHRPVHSYRPDKQSVRESCLDDIDTCDLYVVILGHCYGFEPEDVNPEKLSITHLEFRRAGQSKLPIIALFRTSIPDVRLTDLNDLVKYKKLIDFHSEVHQLVRAGEFKHIAGLISGLSTGVQHQVELMAEKTRPAPQLYVEQSGRQLRDPVGDFVGRAAEIDRIVAALSKVRTHDDPSAVVVVRGMGGVGKTELAYKVATRLKSEFLDGQLLVELGGETSLPLSAEQALRSLTRDFVPQETLNKADTVGKLEALYKAALAGKRFFVLADNAKGADQVRSLLPPTGCALLVTTRQRFTVPGMIDVDLNSFTADVAELLLRQICPRIGVAAAKLAKLCGCLPLALRISASMLASDDAIRVERYLERFADQKQRLSLLHDPDDPAFDVNSSFRLSYDALEPAARDTLCQLCVFPASFDLKAVLGVVCSSGSFDIEELLSVLRRRSLVDWSEDEQRYNLHDLVRVFASAQASGVDDVRKRHAQYFARLMTSAKEAFNSETGNEPTEAANALTSDTVPDLWELSYTEATNILAGWRWAEEHMGDSDADTLLVSYAQALQDDMVDELVDPELMETSLAVLRRDRRHQDAMSLLRQLGDYYIFLDSARARRYYDEGCAIACGLQQRSAEAGFLILTGMTYLAKDADRELASYEQALKIAREVGSRWLEGSALANIGSVNAGITDRALYEQYRSFTISEDTTAPMLDSLRAIERYQQALEIWKADGFKSAAASVFARLGMLYDRLDEAPKALEYYERALAVLDLDRPERRTVLRNAARLHYAREEYAKAFSYAEQLLHDCRERNEPMAERNALMLLGDVSVALEDDQAALNYYTQALPLARELNDMSVITAILHALGSTASRKKMPEEALSYYEQAVASSRQMEDSDGRAELLCTLGMAYDNARRYDDELSAYQEALDLGPAPAFAYEAAMGLGWANFNAGRFGVARREFRRGAKLEPLLIGPELCIGMTYQFEGLYDDAIMVYRLALDLCSDQSEKAKAYKGIGDTLFLSGRYEEALASYQQSSGSIPEDCANLGRMYYLLERFDESLLEYQRSHAANPENVDAVLGLARLYRRMLDNDRFEEALAAAREVIPDDDDEAQARCAAICGKVEDAVTRLEVSLEEGYTTAAWARRDPDFDFIRGDPRFQAALNRGSTLRKDYSAEGRAATTSTLD